MFILERGANLESRAAHTHPKNTQVPAPGENLKTHDKVVRLGKSAEC